MATRDPDQTGEECPNCGDYDTEKTERLDIEFNGEERWEERVCVSCGARFTDVYVFSHKRDIVVPLTDQEVILSNIEKALKALLKARSEIESGSTGENEALCMASTFTEEAYKKTVR